MTKLNYMTSTGGSPLRVGPFNFNFKAGRQSESGYTFAEVTIPPTAQSGPHRHPCEETMFILSGELQFFDETGERRIVGAGETVHVPPGAVHGYVNATATPARLIVVAPVAQEDVFTDMANAAGDPARMAAVLARHGVVPA